VDQPLRGGPRDLHLPDGDGDRGRTIFGLRYTLRQVELANLKSSFVSNVSHELKTPIALIQLAVETLEMKRVTSPEQAQKFLETISREAMRLNSLVDNILDFARLESGGIRSGSSRSTSPM